MTLNILTEPPCSSLIILTSAGVMISPLRGRHVTKPNHTYARLWELELAIWRFPLRLGQCYVKFLYRNGSLGVESLTSFPRSLVI